MHSFTQYVFTRVLHLIDCRLIPSSSSSSLHIFYNSLIRDNIEINHNINEPTLSNIEVPGWSNSLTGKTRNKQNNIFPGDLHLRSTSLYVTQARQNSWLRNVTSPRFDDKHAVAQTIFSICMCWCVTVTWCRDINTANIKPLLRHFAMREGREWWDQSCPNLWAVAPWWDIKVWQVLIDYPSTVGERKRTWRELDKERRYKLHTNKSQPAIKLWQ